MTEISAVHSDIIQTQIFTRLDGQALASASCVSSQLRSLISNHQEKLWKDISTAKWPSINLPRVQDIISTFPSGHRSFFSDAFPVLTHQMSDLPSNRQNNPALTSASTSQILLNRQINSALTSASASSRIISAVDIHYSNKSIFSKLHETGLFTGWLECKLFRVSLLDPKESIPMSSTLLRKEAISDVLSDLEENLTLSWILIDPINKRAANLSSLRPVAVQRHWLTSDIQVKYAMVLADGDNSSGTKDSSVLVECGIIVTCGGGGEEGGEMRMREVAMQVEDMDGKILNGEESLVILRGALESGRRKKKGESGEERKKYEEYLEMRRERKQRRERSYDIIGICIGVTILVSVCCFLFFIL